MKRCKKLGWHQKYLLILTLIICGSVSMQAQSLFVNETDGSQTSYLISDIRSLIFKDNNVTIAKNNGETMDYSISALNFLSFIDYGGGTAIDQPSVGFIRKSSLIS